MNPEDVKALIDQLLKTGEIIATKIFELSIRQVYVYAILDILVGIILLIISYILNRKIAKYFGDEYSFLDDEGIFTVCATALGAVGIILLIASIRFIINPEWFAVKLLLDTFLK